MTLSINRSPEIKMSPLYRIGLFLIVIFMAVGCSSDTDQAGTTGESATDEQAALSGDLPEIKEAHTLAEAKLAAAESGQPILIDFFAEWCGPCKLFAKAVEEDADVRSAMSNVIFISIDCEKGDGVEHAKTYQVQAYPSFVLVNAEGETIARWAGYSKKGWIEKLLGALADLTTIEDKVTRFASAPTYSDAVALATYHDARNEYSEAVRFYREAERLSDDPDQAYTFEIFQSMMQGMRGETFTLDEVKNAADEVMSAASVDPEALLWTTKMMQQQFMNSGQPELAVPYLTAAWNRTADSNDEGVIDLRSRLQADHALYVENDVTKAIEYKKATLSDDWLKSSSEINSFAWWCFEREINLEEAESVARQGVEIADAGRAKGMILDTLADICSARGNHADAISAIQLAILEQPDDDFYKSQLEKFQQRLAGNE